MNSGSGQEGPSQRGSGSAVPRPPHPNGHRHRHSLSQTTYDSLWDKPDPERIPPSFVPPSQNTATASSAAPPRTATGRTKAVARKTTGKFPPRASQPTPKKPEQPIEIPDSDDPEPDSDPAPLEEIRRRAGQKHRNTQQVQSSPARHSRTAATTSSATQRIGPIRSMIRPTMREKRAKEKRPHILPRPNRGQPPPPGAEIVEISSDDERPAAASHVSNTRVARPGSAFIQDTIDLTMDDGDDEMVPTAFLTASAAAGVLESIAPAVHSPSDAPSLIPIALSRGPSLVHSQKGTQVATRLSAFASPGPSTTEIPTHYIPSASFEGLMPAHAPDVPPSNIFAAPSSSTVPVIPSMATPGLIPRRSGPPSSSSGPRSPLPPMLLTDRRTPTSPSTLAAKRPSHGFGPAPFRTHSPLAITVGWDRAAQDVLDTPIEEEDHRLDVDMGGDGYMENEYTSGSTPLQAPTTDDEPPPPSTPNGEDMELDPGILRGRNTSVPVVPVQGPVPVPASVANIVTPLAVSSFASPSRPLASAPPEDIRPVGLDVITEFESVRSQSAPILSKPGREVPPAPALHPASTAAADESDVVEGTDVTMGTTSGDEGVSPEFHTRALPRRPYFGFESSEDELAGGVISEYSSISANVTDNEEIAPAATIEPSDPTDGLTDFAKEIYADILTHNPSVAAYYARMSRKYPGEKLDTRIVDMMNALPKPWKRDVTTRINFESYMMSSVAPYNPWSPPIKVINNIDGQPNPPWEFVYTERMVYGNGVKKPIEAERRARGCDCYPHCKPDDRNCACLRRQEKYGKEVDVKGFRYKDGLLTFTDAVPIFECTDGCRCNEDCPNRVAQYGRTTKIALEKTANKGWGVVAMEPIPAGSFLGVYSGELLLPCEVEVREAFYNTYGRTYTFAIDFHYLKQRGKRRGKKTSAKYAIDAFHAGCFTRYLNHSCDPNCVIIPVVYGEATADTPYLGFYTRFHVKEGEGLEFSYKGVPEEEQITNFARAARFRKKKERAIAAGQKFDTPSALCQCGATNCDGSMWKWEHEKNEDEGEISDDGMEVNEGDEEGQMRSIGVLDDPDDGEYEGSEDEVDQLESDDEIPPQIEMV